MSVSKIKNLTRFFLSQRAGMYLNYMYRYAAEAILHGFVFEVLRRSNWSISVCRPCTVLITLLDPLHLHCKLLSCYISSIFSINKCCFACVWLRKFQKILSLNIDSHSYKSTHGISGVHLFQRLHCYISWTELCSEVLFFMWKIKGKEGREFLSC